MIGRRLTGAIASALLISLLLVPMADGQHRRHRRSRPAKHHGGSPKQLKGKLQEIHEKKVQLRQELQQTKHKANAMLNDIHVVDARMERIADEMERTSRRLGQNQSEQKVLGIELKATTKRLGEVRAQVRKRLRVIYLSGEGSFLSVLAGTRTADDLVSEHALLEAIARRDREMFDDFRQLQKQVARKKRRQDELVAETRSLLVAKHGQKVILATAREEKAGILGQLKQKQSEIQREIAQWDADEADISAEIAAYARRANRPGAAKLPAFVGRFLRPASGPIISTFGMRYHPILHVRRIHAGIDFGAPYGSPIVAAADGQVISARYSTSFGNVVIIAHGGNISTVYAHASQLFVHTGQMVKRGQRIAAVGATGLATGPHLHWEVHVGGHAVNPLGRF